MSGVTDTVDDVVGYWGVLRMLARPTFAELVRDPVEFLRLYGDQAKDYAAKWSWVPDVTRKAIAYMGDFHSLPRFRIRQASPSERHHASWQTVFGTPDSGSPGNLSALRLSWDIARPGVDQSIVARIQERDGKLIITHMDHITPTPSGSPFPTTASHLDAPRLYPLPNAMHIRADSLYPPAAEPETHTLTVPRPARITAVDSQIEADEWTQVSEHSVEFPRTGVTRNMFVSHNRSSVVVVALTDEGDLLTVRQWKHGIGRVTVEFPAGYLENELEDPVAAGMRELHEETGYTSDHWLYLGSFYREPGRGRTVLHVCVALECEKRTDPDPDDTEEIDAGLVGVGDVEELMSDGRMPGLHCLGAWAIARPYIRQHLEEV